MPNLKALVHKLQTALSAKNRFIKINQFQNWSERKQRMVTKYVVCEKRFVDGKHKNVTIEETYQMVDVVKALAKLLNESGDS